MSKTRILIADDHAIVRMGLALLLEGEPDMTVVGEAKNGIETVTEAVRLAPDVLVLDLMMPRKDGIAVTEDLRRHLPGTKIVILTSFASSDGIAIALANGAAGVVLKSSAETELVKAIRAVIDGRQFLTAEVKRQLATHPQAPNLTSRQIEILRAVSDGLSNAAIARKLDLAEITVKNHMTAIFEKLRVDNRAEAVSVALQKHLLKI